MILAYNERAEAHLVLKTMFLGNAEYCIKGQYLKPATAQKVQNAYSQGLLRETPECNVKYSAKVIREVTDFLRAMKYSGIDNLEKIAQESEELAEEYAGLRK